MLVLGAYVIIQTVVLGVVIVRRRHRGIARNAMTVAVWTVALVIGALVTLALGLGCFHCTGAGAIATIFGGGIFAWVGAGLAGETAADWWWRRR